MKHNIIYLTFMAMLLTVAWLKIVKKDGHYMLCNFVEKECLPSGLDEEAKAK